MVHVRTTHVPRGQAIYLVLTSSWQTLTIEHHLEKPSFTLPIPAAISRVSGLMRVAAWSGNRQLAVDSIQLLSASPHLPLELYLGSKSIVADGAHWAMITAVPADSMDNPVADQTPVTFRLLRPTGVEQTYGSNTAHLISYQTIYSTTSAGKTLVGVQTQGVHGRQKQLLEVPGMATNFSLHVQQQTLIADGRQTFRLATGPIRDAFGNLVSDGTLVEFLVLDPDGTRRVTTGYTLTGVADVVLENPPSGGKLAVQAQVPQGGHSPVQLVSFRPGLQGIPLHFDRHLGVVTVGPLIDLLGETIPDGTIVQFIPDKGHPVQLEVQEGRARLSLRTLGKGIRTLKVLTMGLSAKLNLKN